jgi:hypothetical protein
MNTNVHRHPLLAAAGLSALTISASGQMPAPTAQLAAPPPPGAGVVNDWLRQQDAAWSHWNLGTEARFRWEDKSYAAVPGNGPAAVDFRANNPVSWNNFELYRVRVHAGWTPCDWFTIYGQGQGAYSTGSAANPNPNDDGPFDLFQGYFTLGNAKEFPVTLKLGRQTLLYGDERMVGVADWSNTGRSFDAVKLRYESDFGWVDAFSSHPVLPEQGGFNEGNRYDFFSGVYGSTRKLVPQFEAQLYFFADNASSQSPSQSTPIARGNSPRDIYTIGTRWQSLPGQFGPWDFNGEFAGQFGDFQYPAGTPGVVNGQRLNQLSYATHIEAGYTFKEPALKPRLSLGFNYGSGDDDPTDQTHGTFVHLYPTNHRFYGNMDFWSWQNALNPYAALTVTPAKNLSLTLTYNLFWLATTSDFFYQANGAARTTGGYGIQPQNGNFGGQEIDLVATFAVKRYLNLQAGFGHYFTGQYVNQAMDRVGGAHDSNWCYAQVRLSL